MIKGLYFGHLIVYVVDRGWVYEDTGVLVSDSDKRACPKCGQFAGENGHDPCIENLTNVDNACCGHGYDGEAYVRFSDGTGLDGVSAVRYFDVVCSERG